jgi:DNA primase
MAKYTKKVILSYDSDDAGVAAAKRAIPILTDAGLEVKMLRMEGAKDPDEYIKKYGADSFLRLIEASRTGFEFKLESTLQKYNLSVAQDKIKASAEMCEYISEEWSSAARDVYIGATAARLAISPEGLKNDVELLRRKKIKSFNEKTSQQARLGAMGVGDKINADGIKNIKAKAAEEAVIGLLLIYDEYRDAIIRERAVLSADDFVSEFHARVFEKIISLQRENQYDFSLLGEFFTPDEMGRLQGLEQKRRVLTENGNSVFLQCVQTVKDEKRLSSASADGIDEIKRLLEQKRGQGK